MILLGVCAGDDIKVETVMALLKTSNLPPDKTILFMKGGYVHVNRRNVVKRALEMNVTHVMFIDHDMVFPPTGIDRLFKQKKDIIGGQYNVRAFPATSTVKMEDENGHFINWNTLPEEPFQCAALGTGFMLIDINVFKKVEEPWFFFADLDGDEMTEDVYFCRKARKAGFEVWCDPTIPLSHLGQYAF